MLFLGLSGPNRTYLCPVRKLSRSNRTLQSHGSKSRRDQTVYLWYVVRVLRSNRFFVAGRKQSRPNQTYSCHDQADFVTWWSEVSTTKPKLCVTIKPNFCDGSEVTTKPNLCYDQTDFFFTSRTLLLSQPNLTCATTARKLC